MSDTAAAGAPEPTEDGGPAREEAPPALRICQEPGCPNEIAADAHHAVRYCEDHTRRRTGAPKRDTGGPAPVTDVLTPPPDGYRPGPIARQVQRELSTIGRLVWMADPIVGGAIIQNSYEVAKAAETWAASSPKVKAAFESGLTTSGALGFLMACLPLIVVVLARVGVLPRHFIPADLAAADAAKRQAAAAQVHPMPPPRPEGMAKPPTEGEERDWRAA